MSTFVKNAAIYIVIVIFLFLVLIQVVDSSSAPKQEALSTLAAMVNEGQVTSIVTDQDQQTLRVKLKNGDTVISRKEQPRALKPTLLDFGATEDKLAAIEIRSAAPRPWDNILNVAIQILPIVLFGGLILFLFRQAQGGTNQAMSFGRSKARMLTGDTPTVTFEDVAGVDEAKQELAEEVEFLKEPEKFLALGARIPRGLLMVGAPGCGKTLLARAVAGEAGVPFFSISGSEFVEMFVGVGASRVRDLFDQAKKHSPCIVFIDEIDAVGRQRGAGLGGSHDEREQTLNQILVEMDGFDTDTNVIVVAATNRPDILDPALLRPGRFDRRVVVDRPDMHGRLSILTVHAKGKPLAEDVDLEAVAKQTPGFSGADLENLVNEAAIMAARRNGRVIRDADFREAADKVRYGPERRSRTIQRNELEITAYHEAGHAVVSHLIPECDPVQKITIIPRGLASGMVTFLPEDDRYLRSRTKFRADLAAALGGRAAEEVVFGDVSTGASSDLEYVTRTAREMVTRYGMSELLGPITFGEKHELVFLGRELSDQRNYSEAVAREIDQEIRRLVAEAYDRSRQLITDNLDRVHRVARRLLDLETLDRQEFEASMAEAASA